MTHAITRYLRNHGSQFEKHALAFEEGGARDDAYIEEPSSSSSPRKIDQEKGRESIASDDENEKRDIREFEKV